MAAGVFAHERRACEVQDHREGGHRFVDRLALVVGGVQLGDERSDLRGRYFVDGAGAENREHAVECDAVQHARGVGHIDAARAPALGRFRERR